MHIVRVIVIVVMDASGLLHDLTVGQSVQACPFGPVASWPLCSVGFMDIANLIGSGHNRAMASALPCSHSPRGQIKFLVV